MSNTRRASREAALQYLYQEEFNRELDRAECIPEKLMPQWPLDAATAAFANDLCRGVADNRQEIDTVISEHSVNWKFNRISLVDRNIMRIAVYELNFLGTPPKVTINEAIEIAKRFGDEKSPGFVNGILDSILAGTK